jgi:hypothetical protein
MPFEIKQVVEMVKYKKRYVLDMAKLRGELCDVKEKDWKRMISLAFKEAGEYWHEHMLPIHFADNAKYIYKYQPRNYGYNTKKRNITGQAVDLVFSGDMMRSVQRIIDVREKKNRAEVVIHLHGPSYLYAYSKDYKQPDKAAELATVTKKELQIIGQVIEDSIVKQYNGGSKK